MDGDGSLRANHRARPGGPPRDHVARAAPSTRAVRPTLGTAQSTRGPGLRCRRVHQPGLPQTDTHLHCRQHVACTLPGLIQSPVLLPGRGSRQPLIMDLSRPSHLVRHPNRVAATGATGSASASRSLHGDFESALGTGLRKERLTALLDANVFDVSRNLIPARAVGMGPATPSRRRGVVRNPSLTCTQR
jgi:hypothetical protein